MSHPERVLENKNPTVVFQHPGKVAIELVPTVAPGPGELLVESSRTLISTGSELAVLRGLVEGVDYPFTPGYANVGEVVAVGELVDPIWLGRRVASHGPHARFVTAAAESARPIETAAITDDQAVFFAIAEIALRGLRRSGLECGEAVVVYGLGLLGQLTVRLCRLAGARPVVAVDLVEGRLDLLPEDPAIKAVANPTEVENCVRQATRGRMADVVFEVTGSHEHIPQAFSSLRPQGRYVQLGSPRGPAVPFDFYSLCHAPSYTIIGAHNSSHPAVGTSADPWTMLRHSELFFDLVRDGEVDVASLVTHVVPYREIVSSYMEALDDTGHIMGVIVDWCA